MPQVKLHNIGVGSMKDLFDKKVEQHKEEQLENPFSEWEGAGKSPRRFSKDDEEYGKPKAGSKSELRAQAAQMHVMCDMRYLCDMIWDCAEHKSKDGLAAISFGKLFKLYIAISDKVVGTLLRCRKYGLLHFEGEMLFQRRDDHVMIELAKNVNTCRAFFGQPPLPVGGGKVEERGLGVTEEPIKRRNSYSITGSTSSSKTDTKSKLAPEEVNIPRRNSMPSSIRRTCEVSPLKSETENNTSDANSTLPIPAVDDSNLENTSNIVITVTGEGDDENKVTDSEARDSVSPSKENASSDSYLSQKLRAERSRSRSRSPAPSMGTIEDEEENSEEKEHSKNDQKEKAYY